VDLWQWWTIRGIYDPVMCKTEAFYTVSQKKQDTKLLAITSRNIIRFSKFFSLADSVVNLQQIHVEIFHDALNILLLYLVKYECRKMASF